MKTRGLLKKQTGVVISDKMDKTIIVRVDRLVQHTFYKKFIRRSVKYKVHDENNTGKVGDTVEIIQSRPISKDKRWRLYNVVKKTTEI